MLLLRSLNLFIRAIEVLHLNAEFTHEEPAVATQGRPRVATVERSIHAPFYGQYNELLNTRKYDFPRLEPTDDKFGMIDYVLEFMSSDQPNSKWNGLHGG
jgi:hypothetical protein